MSLAGMLPSRIHALTVAEGETERMIARRAMDESAREQMYEKARAASEQKLQEQVSQTDYRTLESGLQTHAVSGDADACILQAINNLKTNVVVMATRARGGVAGMMMGNTAERLLAALPCSALVVKPDDFLPKGRDCDHRTAYPAEHVEPNPFEKCHYTLDRQWV